MNLGGKLKQDATASSLGNIFQYCVALEKCFDLVPGQKLIIERLGDISIVGCTQIETKNYGDTLTDNHKNLWTTLKNWMDDDFDHRAFASFVLLTTQSFSVESSIEDWNELSTRVRMERLADIHQGLLEQSSGPQKSAVLRSQEFVMDSLRRQKLQDVISKMSLSIDYPGIREISSHILNRHGKGILQARRQDFFERLLGFLISPRNSAYGWEINEDAFTKIVGEATTLYCRDSKIFPEITTFEKISVDDPCRTKLYAKKIEEIEHHSVLEKAHGDYLGAHKVVLEDLVEHPIYGRYYSDYTQKMHSYHGNAFKKACRQASNVIQDSQDFYDDRITSNVDNFPHFDMTPLDFRNGVFHMLADEERMEFHWKLKVSS